MPTVPSTSSARRIAASLENPRCCRTGPAICFPMVMVGLRLVIGSWNTIAMSLPRISRICAAPSGTRSVPRSRIAPAAMWPPGGSSCMIDIAVMVLPHPDSPTSPTVSPWLTVSETPSTGCTRSLRRRISVRRPSISRRSVTEHTSSSSFPEPDLERGAQRVADEVEGDDGQHDRDPGRVDQPPLALVHVVEAVGEHAAPVGGGRRGAESQVAQRGQQQDGVGHLERGLHHDGADGGGGGVRR